ncbi:MAG: ribosome silencing factor [Atopobiaceae bacterium]|nr:ribosome silencing factor [Atopobiaceae bacterium]MDO4403407.1 ribosome silencing factor [Atopobiaceae bacterium]
MPVTPLELAKVAATAADDKKATDILVLDLTEKSDVCDYFVICTVANNPMMDAVTEGIEEKVRLNCGEKPLSVEGRAGATWLLIDYGAVVIHVFREEAREFYRLERLWGDAPHVKLDLEGATPESEWLSAGEGFEDMPEE